jgi:hypothetical protein
VASTAERLLVQGKKWCCRAGARGDMRPPSEGVVIKRQLGSSAPTSVCLSLQVAEDMREQLWPSRGKRQDVPHPPQEDQAPKLTCAGCSSPPAVLCRCLRTCVSRCGLPGASSMHCITRTAPLRPHRMYLLLLITCHCRCLRTCASSCGRRGASAMRPPPLLPSGLHSTAQGCWSH